LKKITRNICANTRITPPPSQTTIKKCKGRGFKNSSLSTFRDTENTNEHSTPPPDSQTPPSKVLLHNYSDFTVGGCNGNNGVFSINSEGTRADPVMSTSHVFEVYDFSPSVKTIDLENLFLGYDKKIKWVDDTHALIVFRNPDQALHAISSFPISDTYGGTWKIRPFCDASPKAQSVQNKDTLSLSPPVARPKTTAVVARRLITNALELDHQKTEKEIKEEEELNKLRTTRAQLRNNSMEVWLED